MRRCFNLFIVFTIYLIGSAIPSMSQSHPSPENWIPQPQEEGKIGEVVTPVGNETNFVLLRWAEPNNNDAPEIQILDFERTESLCKIREQEGTAYRTSVSYEYDPEHVSPEPPRMVRPRVRTYYHDSIDSPVTLISHDLVEVSPGPSDDGLSGTLVYETCVYWGIEMFTELFVSITDNEGNSSNFESYELRKNDPPEIASTGVLDLADRDNNPVLDSGLELIGYTIRCGAGSSPSSTDTSPPATLLPYTTEYTYEYAVPDTTNAVTCSITAIDQAAMGVTAEPGPALVDDAILPTLTAGVWFNPSLPGSHSGQMGVSWLEHDNANTALEFSLTRAPSQPDVLFSQPTAGGAFTQDPALPTTPVPPVPDFASRSASWGDMDNDGDLDLFIATQYRNQHNLLYINDGAGNMVRNTMLLPAAAPPAVSHSGSWGHFNQDDSLDLFVANGKDAIHGNYQNVLYINKGIDPLTGEVKFAEHTLLTPETNSGQTTSGTWADVDNDGDFDIFLTDSDETEPNKLFLNNGGTDFVIPSASDIADLEQAKGVSVGASFGDFNHDGFLDLVVTNTSNSNNDASNFLFTNEPGTTAPARKLERILVGEVVSESTKDSYGSAFADFDNDCYLDLFVANKDGQTNSLFRNDGNGNFVRRNYGPVANGNKGSRGAAWGDYDKDGYIDLLVANQNHNYYLYKNITKLNPSITLPIRPPLEANWSGIGHQIRYTLPTKHGTLVTLTREVSGLTGWSSQNSHNVHLGLGCLITTFPCPICPDPCEDCEQNPGGSAPTNPTGAMVVVSDSYDQTDEQVNIEMTVREASALTAELYASNGKVVQALARERRFPKGVHAFTIPARGLRRGVYYFRVSTEGAVFTRPIIIPNNRQRDRNPVVRPPERPERIERH